MQTSNALEYAHRHQRRYLAYSEDALTLRLTSELVDLRVGYAKWSQQSFVSNSSDSKGIRAYHLVSRESSCFLAKSLKCFIFLEFWMNAFYHRPCKSRAKFKHNLIRRDIEVVITGLTRNQFALTRTRVRIPLSPPNRPQFSRIAVLILHYKQFDK